MDKAKIRMAKDYLTPRWNNNKPENETTKNHSHKTMSEKSIARHLTDTSLVTNQFILKPLQIV